MKPFSKKLIVLSMAALVLAGSGCERRGRAPVQQKKTNQGGTADSGKKPTDVAPNLNPTAPTQNPTNPSNPTAPSAPTASAEEKALIERAMLPKCKVAIDEKEAASEKTFAADVPKLLAFFACLGTEGGIRFHDHKPTKKWLIWESLEHEKAVTGSAGANFALKEEFIKLAKEKNDEEAEAILIARLELFRLNADKIRAKYAPGKIDQDKEISIAKEQGFAPSGVQKDLNSMIEATVSASAFVKKVKSVDKGEDMTDKSGTSDDAGGDVDAE